MHVFMCVCLCVITALIPLHTPLFVGARLEHVCAAAVYEGCFRGKREREGWRDERKRKGSKINREREEGRERRGGEKRTAERLPKRGLDREEQGREKEERNYRGEGRGIKKHGEKSNWNRN